MITTLWRPVVYLIRQVNSANVIECALLNYFGSLYMAIKNEQVISL